MKRASPSTRAAAILAFAAVLSVAAVRPAAALQHPEAMTDFDLARVRGGYLSANGLTFGFGASVTTSIDGVLALESRLIVTDTGVVKSQTAGSAPGAATLDPAVSATLGGLSGRGVVIAGGGGASNIVQSLTGDQILNVVLNTASNRTITQNTAVTLTLPAFDQLQRNAAAQQLNASLLSAVGVGAVGAIRH